jgi:prepilin-type N-terminal cleavage/methylation domain-containing protein
MSRRNGGWTLIEMLIVMIIICLLLTGLVALFNEMFRGQTVREGARLLSQGLADARQLAATQRTYHTVRLINQSDGGVLEIYEDTNNNRSYDANDKLVPGGRIFLPPHCYFLDAPKVYPDWVCFSPTGGCKYSPGYAGVERSDFDNNANLSNPLIQGDVVLEVRGRPYKMLIDIDRVTGKVRRQEFLFNE